MDSNIFIYSKTLMDHYHNPRLSGNLEDPHFSIENINEACGDLICITGKIEKGILTDIRHHGKGCIISQASASITAEYAINKPINIVQSLTEQELCALAQIEVGPYRLRCVVLALHALQKGIMEYVGSN